MSIDKSTMKIFFEAMEGTMIGSGYSSKIVTTPMGPFKWNSTTELWENVNNGMTINNISFQDMMMMDYSSTDGGLDWEGVFYGSFGSLVIGTGMGSTDYWASVGSPVTDKNNASFITFKRTTTIVIESSDDGSPPTGTFYSKNNGDKVVNTGSALTFNRGDTLRIGLTTPPTPEEELEIGSGTINIYSPALPSLLTTVAYSFTIPVLS